MHDRRRRGQRRAAWPSGRTDSAEVASWGCQLCRAALDDPSRLRQMVVFGPVADVS